MTTNKFYTLILETIPEGLEKKLLDLFLTRIESGVETYMPRKTLVYCIFGYAPKDINNSSEDRQVRLAIKSLVSKGFPIISNSGRGGYKLEANAEAREVYILELESRREHLKEQILALRNANILDSPPNSDDEIQLNLPLEG